jgi:hypothetical protein
LKKTFYLVANRLVQFTYLANQRACVKLCSVEQVFTYLANQEQVLNYVVLCKCCGARVLAIYIQEHYVQCEGGEDDARIVLCCCWGESSLQILHTKRQNSPIETSPFDSMGKTLSLTFKFVFHTQLAAWITSAIFFNLLNYNSVGHYFIPQMECNQKVSKEHTIKLGITLQDLKKL